MTPEQIVAANVRGYLAMYQVPRSVVRETLGISQAALGARMAGRTAFNFSQLFAIADLVGLPPEKFLVDRDAPRPEPEPDDPTDPPAAAAAVEVQIVA